MDFLAVLLVFLPNSSPDYCPRRDFALRRSPEEAPEQLTRILRTVLTVQIYSQYTRKNLDLLEQGPRGIGR